MQCIASRSLSSGAHSRDPLARNDVVHTFVHDIEHWNLTRSSIVHSSRRAYAHNFFIIFVDGMFTTFITRLFTNAFDASRKNSVIACVVHAGHAD